MIFLFLLTSGISVYFLAIESQTTMIETQETINNLQTKKMQENYAVSISTDSDDNNRLAIQIKNNGHFPLEIADFWIINKTDAVNEYPVLRFDVNFTEPFIPPGYGANILENYPLYMNPDVYNIKVVSTLGTIHQKEIVVGGANNLRAELFAIPADVKVGQNATIALHVTNVGDTRLLNVLPNNMTITPSSGVSLPFPPVPNPVTLDPAESMIFSWNYQVAGMPGNNVIFTTNVTATEDVTNFNYTSNIASDEITLREPDVEEIIVLTQDLLSRPEIFMTIPGPFGDDPNSGLWGMNVVNPTPQTMNVTQIIIATLNPRSDSGDQIFVDNCLVTGIFPTIGNWHCPSPNQLLWEETGVPVSIAPYSVAPFYAKVDPGGIAGFFDDVEAIVVHGSVFTTVGEFGKSGYATSMDTTSEAIANVFLADSIETLGNNNIIINMSNISPNSEVTFNATIADFTTTTTRQISSGSTLIINIPKGWSNVNILSSNGFDTPTIQTFPDTSSQIIGVLSDTLTGETTPNNAARTIQFNATSPNVSTTQMYVMYILADGTTGDGFKINPLSEVVLQVVP